MGLSAAYHLARRRSGPIVLLEKGTVGDGSSSRAAGIITGLLWSETVVRCAKALLGFVWRAFPRTRRLPTPANRCLNLFSAEGWSERQKLLPLYDRLQAPREDPEGTRGRRAVAGAAAAGGHDRIV